MISRAEAIDAVNFDLEVSTSDGTTYSIDDPINGDSDTASAYVFDFQYAGNSQPGDMTRGSQQFSGWTPLSAAERVEFEGLLGYIETIINVDFQQVAGQADPTMNVGKVSLPGVTAGVGGFDYSVSISGGNATLADYDNFVVYDNTIPIQSGQENLILHEILHALSMKHPFDGSPTLPPAFENNKYTVLSYDDNPDNGMRSDGLQLFDIAAIQQRWGANLATAAGNDTYTGSRNTTVDTVWDAGGTDTFDASSRTTDVTLSLLEATFSTFTVTDDVAIAYDTVIENAIGGSGNDTIVGNAAANTLRGNAGNDVITAGNGHDVVRAGTGDNSVDLGNGDDFVAAGGGQETFIGGNGTDYISYYGSAGGVSVNLGTNAVSGGMAADDTISGFESISGSNTGGDTIRGTTGANVVYTYGGNDKVYGGNGHDTVYGGNGNDTLFGGNGHDRFFGGNGNDRLSGGNGNDLLYGLSGNDTLTGGRGLDTFHFDLGGDRDIVRDFQDDIDTIEFDGFTFANGETVMDYASQSGDDVIFDFGGGDRLTVENATIGQLNDDWETV